MNIPSDLSLKFYIYLYFEKLNCPWYKNLWYKNPLTDRDLIIGGGPLGNWKILLSSTLSQMPLFRFIIPFSYLH